MELKGYQKNVLGDLKHFLDLLIEKQNIKQAYNTLWEEKGISVGIEGMPPYHTVLSGVPHVCMKVPTGGGKTFIAASSIKIIFDSMPHIHPMAVVWLVPSDAILQQTINALQDSGHPYRMKINADFGGSIEVYTKEQLLTGQNFNPISVGEHLSIFVLSYDSFRTSKKEGRKAYQENGYLAEFAGFKADKGTLLENTDETALIQVIRKLNPVVIVDESHHATSDLSVEMLQNFNPSFVLELTATPKERSNIISFVDAKQLKKEEMIKLPVIVYNRKTQEDVFLSAIGLRQKLENEAAQMEDGKYIRPIVLFQAEPKNKDDSTTYEKIKKILLDIGIPEEQIAIKTADRDDIKKQDLLSRNCEIRYIITINALKEGWDCPFAYILATVANRSSVVDVEQILGRVLRMPYTKASKRDVLNLSYVITSSADFLASCEQVVKGLNAAGFSKKDYRVLERDEEACVTESPIGVQLSLENITQPDVMVEKGMPDINTDMLTGVFPDILKDASAIHEGEMLGTVSKVEEDITAMLSHAEAQNNVYWEEMNNDDEDILQGIPEEEKVKMKTYEVKPEFRDEIKNIKIPQFVIETGPSLFSDCETALLEKEDLYKGFSLKSKDTEIDFNSVSVEIAKVDVEDSVDGMPKAWQLSGFDRKYLKEWFDTQPSDKKRRLCKGMICKKISKINAVNDRELEEYVSRIMANMTEDQLTDLEQSPYPYIVAVEKKVKQLLQEYAAAQFALWLEQERIQCAPTYYFSKVIAPAKTIATIPKSLYEEEEQFDNDYEKKVVWELSALSNVKWWHRNSSRKGFAINGAVTAYPDLIVMTESGKILLIETKGDQLENSESRVKAENGSKWAAKASMLGRLYKYYMVFQRKEPGYEGAYSHDRFMEIVKGL